MQPWCKKCQAKTTSSARSEEARKKKFLYDQHRWELKSSELLAKNKEHVDKIRNNPDFKLARYKANLKYTFGINYEEYEEMVKAQNNLCAICKQDNTSKHRKLHVDHDHKTGKIRGLLCVKCNTMLGSANDSVLLLRTAIEYLSKYYE